LRSPSGCVFLRIADHKHKPLNDIPHNDEPSADFPPSGSCCTSQRIKKEKAVTGKLKAEIKQTRPFSSIHEEVVLSLVRTADEVLAPLTAVLREANLSLSQYNILRVLRGAGAESLPCGEISERMVRRDPDLTRLLDRLDARGLIGRSRGTADRRVVLASITEKGRQLLAQLDEPIRRATHAALSHMTAARLESLGELLDAARSAPQPK
jgi:DNA-binding MarR family transcriptional regulator